MVHLRDGDSLEISLFLHIVCKSRISKVTVELTIHQTTNKTGHLRVISRKLHIKSCLNDLQSILQKLNSSEIKRSELEHNFSLVFLRKFMVEPRHIGYESYSRYNFVAKRHRFLGVCLR